MTAALTIEQAAARATAAAVVADARKGIDPEHRRPGIAVTGRIRVAAFVSGSCSVTGADRRVRIVADQVAAIREVEALLLEQAAAERAADVERADELALAEDRQAEREADRLGGGS